MGGGELGERELRRALGFWFGGNDWVEVLRACSSHALRMTIYKKRKKAARIRAAFFVGKQLLGRLRFS